MCIFENLKRILALCTIFALTGPVGYAKDKILTEKGDRHTQENAQPPYFAQIWFENFADLADATAADSGNTAWTSSITQGTFEVQGGLMFLQGINGGSNATWISQDIDISNHTNISISYLVGDALDGEKETSDYVRGFYVLDNGSRVQFANITDDVPTPVSQSISGLNGNTIRIEIDFRVSYGNETYTIDDILVEGTPIGDSEAPTPPTALVGTSASSTAIDLSWQPSSDNVGVGGYKVFQDNVEIESNWVGTTYQAVGLAPATTYEFKVRAFDAAGNQSTDSNIATIATDSGNGGGGSSVWSEQENTASYNGEVAIGTNTVPNGYKMAVSGNVIAEEIRVQLSGNWPDYVFSQEYRLTPLKEIQKYIEKNGHLPRIPSAKEVEGSGIVLGEMNRLLLEKIEELTLHAIQQEERIEELQEQLKALSDNFNEK